MKVSITSLDQSSLISSAIGKDFQLMTFRNYPGLDPDNNYVWWYGGGNPVNFPGFDDPDVNRLLDAGRATPDRAATAGDLRRAQPGPGRAGLLPVVDLDARGRVPMDPAFHGVVGARPTDGSTDYTGLALGHDMAYMWKEQWCRWPRELGKRLLSLVLVLFLVTLFSALLLSLVPGDPVDTLVPLAPSEEADAIKAQVREDLELDEPLPQRYVNWVSDFITGDENGEHFGEYFRVSGRDPVSTRLSEALPVSLQLMVYAQVLALVIAIPLGVLTAYRAGSKLDKAANTGAFALLAIPNFVLGLRPRVLPRRLAQLAPPSGYVPVQRGRGRALPPHDPAGHHAGRRPGRGVHAAAAQRHGGHAAGGLHPDGQVEGHLRPAGAVAPRAAAVEPHAADGGRPRTSARSSAARSSSR